MLQSVYLHLIGKYSFDRNLLLECNTAREICAVSEFYAAWNGSSVPTFRDGPSRPSSRIKQSKKKFMDRTFEEGTDRLPRNVGMEISFFVA